MSTDVTTDFGDSYAGAGGFRPPARVYRLQFAEEDMAGLEVKARGVDFGTFLDLSTLAAGDGTEAQQVEKLGQLVEGFAAALLGWNVEAEDGTPVPATLDGLRAQDPTFVLSIIAAWMQAISGVAAPLGTHSPNGATIQEASLPMAPLSESPQPSTEPN